MSMYFEFVLYELNFQCDRETTWWVQGASSVDWNVFIIIFLHSCHHFPLVSCSSGVNNSQFKKYDESRAHCYTHKCTWYVLWVSTGLVLLRSSPSFVWNLWKFLTRIFHRIPLFFNDFSFSFFIIRLSILFCPIKPMVANITITFTLRYTF